MIAEPVPFSKDWYSHKFKCAGLRYELVTCIATGDIVSFTGPFPCGTTGNPTKCFQLQTARDWQSCDISMCIVTVIG